MMKRKYVGIDFEFNGTAEPLLNLVCCSLRYDDQVLSYWLHQDEFEKENLKEKLIELNEQGYIFIAHQVAAEASSFISLGLNPTDFKWIDTMMEFRCLSNHNHKFQYGLQLIEGKPTKTVPPKNKYERTEEDSSDSSNKINHSYSQLVFKFLGVVIDTDRKTKMRDIIIASDVLDIEAHSEEIMQYCEDDTKHLLPCLKKMVDGFNEFLTREDMSKLVPDMLYRGETSARTAKMERLGYPIDVEKTKNFASHISSILNACARDINRQFPDKNLFVFKKKDNTFTFKQEPQKEFIRSLPFQDKWMKTDKKDLSLSLDAWTQFFPFSHSYPEYNFGAQIVRYLKLKQMLNGFKTEAKKGGKTFWDSVGSDGRVRPYLNPYGSLSGRYQPPSTGFLFLKPAWTRSLCVPPKGRMIVGIDYKSEEFFISGLWSGDEAMVKAYKSGDVYLAFATDSGLAPIGATKASHPIERGSAKSAVLGISYLMTKFGLAIKMTQDLGREVDEDEAQEFIDSFNETYEVHTEAVEDFLESFSIQGYHRLSDGWILFADNDNFRSVANYPKQGQGGVILRKAIALAQDAGLDVIIPLHDAGYFEVDLNDWSAVSKCIDVMKRGFYESYKGTDAYEESKNIMLDIEVWSPELEEGTKIIDGHKVKVEKLHKDERAKGEYEMFSKYFESSDDLL